MAKRPPLNVGSWLKLEGLLESGDPEFVNELRRIQDADRLGSFAKVLHADKRPASRRLLLEYLGCPFNAFRHEVFLKRLFKIAEAAQDDEVMAHFMVGFDRSIRRERKSRSRYDWNTRESWTEEFVRMPRGTTLLRAGNPFVYVNRLTGEPMAASSIEKNERLMLFSLATRKYLRRRVWRYFRQLGKTDVARYLKGIQQSLTLYRDQDCRDGLALLDNWSLVHVLFHHSDVLVSKSRTWNLVDGRSLSELRSAPAFPDVWNSDPEPLLCLLDEARCRPVRQWSVSMLRERHEAALAKISLDRILRWIMSDDEELANFAADLLSRSNKLGAIQVTTWLQLIRSANPEALAVVCQLAKQTLAADVVTLSEAIVMACSRSVPIAELGMLWVEGKVPSSEQDFRDLMQSVEAEAEVVRPRLVEVVRKKLDTSDSHRAESILEFLDSRHQDVRDVGWAWLKERTDVSRDYHLWQRLLETPYDDIRVKVIELLTQEAQQPTVAKRHSFLLLDAKKLPADRIRLLWANVLLNIHRGGKQKRGVVRVIVDRLQSHNEEAGELLPLLAVALRSVRSQEWQAGLTGVVRFVEKNPAAAESIRAHFPELNLI